MGAVQLTEARVFEMLGRVFAECHDRAQRETVLEQQVQTLAGINDRLQRECADLTARLPAPMATDV